MYASIITPSWTIKSRKEYDKGTSAAKKLGIIPVKEVFPKKELSIKQKIDQLHNAFKDPKSSLVLCQRGGYGVMKILPYLDMNLIRRSNKTLAGFSDITALLNPISQMTGKVTLHSPMISNFAGAGPLAGNSLKNALSGFPEKDLLKGSPVRSFNPGKASGKLYGGNLVTITALTGTKWELNTDNAIIFIEDLDERIRMIDRCLTNWIMNSKFRKVKGLVLGDFKGLKTDDIFRIISSQIKVDFPVIACPNIGHGRIKLTLPVGAEVLLDADKKTLRLK